MSFPEFIEAPTTAYVPGPGGSQTPILPGTLCNYNEGSTDPTDGWAFIQVLKSICPTGTQFQVIQVNDGPFEPMYPASETRRQRTLWIIYPPGGDPTLLTGSYGFLENWLREWFGPNDENGGGIGNPGSWALALDPGSTSKFKIPIYSPAAPPPPPPPAPAPILPSQLVNLAAAYNDQPGVAPVTLTWGLPGSGTPAPSAPSGPATVFP